MQIVILAGGVGGSRFILGARRAYPDASITVVGNTADDITLHGLRICPDLDTIMYTLGRGSDAERGWGRRDESWQVMSELTAYAAEPTWFSLGDRDLGTHLVRTQLLNAGYPLSEVTAALTTRWLAHEPQLRLLPMTDDRVETHVTIADDQAPGGRRAVHFQEYWVRLHAEPAALDITLVGRESARPAPGVTEAIREADLILVAPSNPGGLHRPDPAGGRDPAGPVRTPPRRWWGSPESSAGHRCSAWPTGCYPRSGWRSTRRRSAGTTDPVRPAGSSTCGRWTPPMPVPPTGCARPGCGRSSPT